MFLCYTNEVEFREITLYKNQCSVLYPDHTNCAIVNGFPAEFSPKNMCFIDSLGTFLVGLKMLVITIWKVKYVSFCVLKVSRVIVLGLLIFGLTTQATLGG